MLSLSVHQFGTLRYVASNKVTLEDLEGVHGGTLGSLLHRHYLTRGTPNGEKTRIILTKTGQDELDSYIKASPRERLHPGALTDRCAGMLRVARILQMAHRAHAHDQDEKAG